MDRLTPTSKFDLWKLRTIPHLESKAKKMGITEVAELLPMVLDDTLCTAYAQWLNSHKNPNLTDAIDFLESWMVANKSVSSNDFLSRKWVPGETIEEYIADLESLAALLYIKPSDRAFKLHLIDGLPPEAQPFLRMEITGSTWPSISQLIEKTKALRIVPTNNSFTAAVTSQHGLEERSRPNVSRPVIQCFNCQGYGHLARGCASPRQTQGKGNRL
jgi:hypothetical protein